MARPSQRSGTGDDSAPWPLLRKDLVFLSSTEGGRAAFLVRDPLTNELFEFGREEHFLLLAMDGTAGARRTMAEFEKRFGMTLSRDSLDEFIKMIGDWGLLSGHPIVPFDLARARAGFAPQGAGQPGGGRRGQGPGAPPPADDVDWYDDAEAYEEEPATGFGDALGYVDQTPGGQYPGSGPAAATSEIEELPRLTGYWSWFNPTGLLSALGAMWSALSWLTWLTPVLIVAGIATIAFNSGAYLADFGRYRLPLSVIQNIFFSMVTINLLTQIAGGVTARRAGVETPSFGARLGLGIIPRFHVEIGSLQDTTRNQRLWIHGAPLLTRLALFGAAALLWMASRGAGTSMSAFALMLTVVSLISLAIAGNPLMKGSGYFLMTTYLDLPNLGQRANRALIGGFRGKGGPELDEAGQLGLKAFSLASLIFVMTLLGWLMFLAAEWLELAYQGTGVVLFLVLLALLVMHFRRQIRAKRAARDQARGAGGIPGAMGGAMGRAGGGGPGRGAGMAGMGGGMGGMGGMGAGMGMGGGQGGMTPERLAEVQRRLESLPPERRAAIESRLGPRAGELLQRGAAGPGRQGPGPAPVEAQRPAEAPAERRSGWLRWALLAVVVVVLALPYPYETGGPVDILPLERQEIHVEVPGIVDEVFFDGGERLDKGTVFARVVSAEQEKDILTTRAAISEAEADLNKLLAMPRPEDLQLALQGLETAEVQARFSRENAERMERLYSSGNISLDMYKDAQRAFEVDKAQVLEAKANLAKVKSGAHPQEIEAARYELERLREQLKYHDDQLTRTSLKMPFDGRLVTANLRYTVGQYLDKGQLYAVAENDSRVRVHIQIPQSDIADFGLGSRVRVKIWTYPDRIFEGEVTEIGAVVEEETYGDVITVTTLVDNPTGVLKSGMTGFAKIDGGTKPVFVAFTRMFVRFFMIEIWSWIP